MFIIQSALQTLKKYADFKGRASRRGGELIVAIAV
jgi:hypothetical protein